MIPGNLKLPLLALPLLVVLAGCNPQSRGFSLPKGDVAQGEADFVRLQCIACHSVGDVEWAGATTGETIHVKLGGQTTALKTYADLLTSIVNPSHKLSRGNDPGTVTDDGRSRMRVYNNVMTVQELIDIVTFLQESYEVWTPEPYPYGM